jgi:hypothetical protein
VDGTDGDGKVVAEERVTIPMGSYVCLKVQSFENYAYSQSVRGYANATPMVLPGVQEFRQGVIHRAAFKQFQSCRKLALGVELRTGSIHSWQVVEMVQDLSHIGAARSTGLLPARLRLCFTGAVN